MRTACGLTRFPSWVDAEWMRTLTRIADRLVNRLAPRATAAAQGCYPYPCDMPDGSIGRTLCCPGRGCGPCHAI